MKEQILPDEMTAVVLTNFDGVEAIRVENRPVPQPGKNEVLVKVAASPINPSDLSFLLGRYGGTDSVPVVPGFEASGTVVAAGPGAMGRYLLGKPVACLRSPGTDGLWSEYAVVKARNGALPLGKGVSLETGAMSIVNPLTAIAFREILREGRNGSCVLTAAASSLGLMVNRLLAADGRRVINVVRRDDQAELLKSRGAVVVLKEEDPDFEQRLREACREHDTKIAFDAVAGETTGRILQAMPDRSRMLVFGALSFEPVRLGSGDLVFHGKTVEGFWLSPWAAGKGALRVIRLWREIQKMMNGELASEIRATYPFHNAAAAIRDYQERMTGGKVLLVPDSRA